MDGWLTLGTKVDTSGVDEGIEEIEDKADNSSNSLKRIVNEIGKRLTNTFGRGLKKAVGLTGKMGKAFMGIFTTIARISLALGAIGGIILLIVASIALIVKAIAKVFKENEQLKADLKYLGFAVVTAIQNILNLISNAVEPSANRVANVLQKILNLIIKIIQYVAYLIHAWTGVNLFEGASISDYAEKMKEAEKSSAETAKNAKEIKKQLAGFDEMNILNDNSGAGTSNASGGISTPSFDLSNFENIDIPVWLQKLGDLKTTWEELGNEMRDNLYNMPFSLWTDAFGEWDLAVYGFTQMIDGLWKIVDGFINMAKGLWEMLTGLITGDTEKMKQGGLDFFKGLWEVIVGFWENIKGLWNLLTGLIGGILSTIWNLIVSLANKIVDKIVGAWVIIRDKIKQIILDIKIWLTEKFGAIGTVIGDVIGNSVKKVINAILTRMENTINGFVGSINLAIDALNNIPGVKMNKLKLVNFPRLAKGGIINMPGKGVPLGGVAKGGEVAPEGVIPLTDSQQMALLGESIGKFVNINATIPVYVANRLIMREFKRINAEDDFAFNR